MTPSNDNAILIILIAVSCVSLIALVGTVVIGIKRFRKLRQNFREQIRVMFGEQWEEIQHRRQMRTRYHSAESGENLSLHEIPVSVRAAEPEQEVLFVENPNWHE